MLPTSPITEWTMEEVDDALEVVTRKLGSRDAAYDFLLDKLKEAEREEILRN